MVDAIIHVKTQDVIQDPDYHKAINFGLKLKQHIDVNRLAAQLDLIDQIAFCLFVMVSDKRLVQRFGSAKIKFLHPIFMDERLKQLLKDHAIGKEFLVARIVYFRLRCFSVFVLHRVAVYRICYGSAIALELEFLWNSCGKKRLHWAYVAAKLASRLTTNLEQPTQGV